MTTKTIDLQKMIVNHLEGVLKRTKVQSPLFRPLSELIGEISTIGLDAGKHMADTTLTAYHEGKEPADANRKVMYSNFLTFLQKAQDKVDSTMHFAGNVESEETMWGKLPDGRSVYVHIARYEMAPEGERELPEYWLSQLTEDEDASVWVK